MESEAGAGLDGYMECSIYVEHGACSCSTGVPGNVCPVGAEDQRQREYVIEQMEAHRAER